MKKYVQKSGYDCTQLDDEWIILNTDQFTVTKVNEVGGYCWSLLSSQQTVESLMQAVHKEYPAVEPFTVREMEEYLEKLTEYGLVTNDI